MTDEVRGRRRQFLCDTQAASLVAVLLSTLTSMAGNAHISKRIIARLAAHPHGRTSLRLGAAKWQAQATGSLPHDPASMGAVQWAVSRLWQLGAGFHTHFSDALFNGTRA